MASAIAGVGGLFAGFFFPVFLFWLSAVVLGVRKITARARAAACRQPSPSGPDPSQQRTQVSGVRCRG
ncbi:hypothetical protein [Lapillicoccus sp.]|uniref:hypothetical protein n=1 Tax=Lapillicoccus sp. TaxID=1909287 RepID=UPI0039837385